MSKMREQAKRLLWGPYGSSYGVEDRIAEVLVERDRLREVVARMEAITEEVEDDESIGIPPHVPLLIKALRDALSGVVPSGSTDSDPALTERPEAAEGAGDGV